MTQQPQRRRPVAPNSHGEHITTRYHRRPTEMEDLPYLPGRAPEDPPPAPVAPAKPAPKRRRKAATTTAGRKTYPRRLPGQRRVSSRRAQAAVQPRDHRGRFSLGTVKDVVTGKALRDQLRRNVLLARKSARENSPVLNTLDHPATTGRRSSGTRRRRRVIRPDERQPHQGTQRSTRGTAQRRESVPSGSRIGVAKQLVSRLGDGFKALFVPTSNHVDTDGTLSEREE
jgi:hypothetical protein